ncbi:MAG: 4-hydroxy-tetrahydrodipicolinate synthase [Eubacteriales bacterium]|nr:4-hydroxy-tetrahydrodipicolinate synthase [Eubacteriales bacterium]
MKKIVFTGSAVAIVTPFNESGIDFHKLDELCEFHIDSGTDAIVVCGTTGEASTMPDNEHLSVIDRVVRYCKGRLPVIAGTGSNDTVHAVELSRKAQDLGADALLCVTPYYNKTSQEGLFRHFSAISSSVAIPLILYNVPSRTGMNIDPRTAYKLSEIENIVAIKECNLAQVPEMIHLCKDSLSVYSGEDGQVLPILAFGGKGVISVMANIIPSETHKMAVSYLNGDCALSRELQIKYIPLIKALFSDVNPIPVKAAMNHLGFNVGKCRMPLCDMNEAAYGELIRIIDSYNIERRDQ